MVSVSYTQEDAYETRMHKTAGHTEKLSEMLAAMGELIEFYPRHIEKEDRHFFPDTERHYSGAELEQMIQEFYTFDMRMIHEKYSSVVDTLAG